MDHRICSSESDREEDTVVRFVNNLQTYEVLLGKTHKTYNFHENSKTYKLTNSKTYKFLLNLGFTDRTLTSSAWQQGVSVKECFE